MNAEQKQRAKDALTNWIADEMAALLQELIDAPEPEPVGYTNETELDYVRTYESLPVSGAFWPTSDEDADIALYTAPPANNQSEQHLEMVNPPAPSVPDSKTLQFLTDVLTADGLLRHGKKDAGLATRIADESCRIRQQLFSRQQEQPADSDAYHNLVREAERYRWLSASNWYVGPDDFYADEAGGLENYQNENFSAENLDTKIDAATEMMRDWTDLAARGECGWICSDCCCSFPEGMPDKCEHGHQSCTDIIQRDKQNAKATS